MQDLYKFIEHSDALLALHLTNTAPKYINFMVPWNNADYEVHYVSNSSTGQANWEMMAYAKLD